MAAMLHMILVQPHAIRGPGKPRLVAPYTPFYCPYSWTLSGPVAQLCRAKRLIPVEDYVDGLFERDEEELRRECKLRGLDTKGAREEMLGRLIDGLSDREVEEPSDNAEPDPEGKQPLDFRGLQKALKDLGLSAAGKEEDLRARYEAALASPNEEEGASEDDDQEVA